MPGTRTTDLKRSAAAARLPATAPHPLPDAALDADIAILGKKGRRKTYTAKGVVERLLTLKRRVLILDPLSVWLRIPPDVDTRIAAMWTLAAGVRSEAT